MRTLCILLMVLTRTAFAFGADAATNTTNALRFYVITEQPVSGGRYVDTRDFPKLGYISNAPSYVLARLQKVFTNDVTSVSFLHRGDKVEIETNTTPAVSITMFPGDAKAFAEFTRQNIDRKVVLILQDQPLMAPMIQAPIETGTLQLGWERRAFPKKVVEAIQSLVTDE